MSPLTPLASGESPSPAEGRGFSESARKLAGVTSVLLGWRPDEFWRATPEELAAIFEALRGDVPPPVPMRDLMERFPDAENWG